MSSSSTDERGLDPPPQMKRLSALPYLYKPRAGLTQGLLTPAEWNAFGLIVWLTGVATAGVRLEMMSGVCSL